MSSKGRVLLAMSGGVDSSAAAGILIDQGYEVIGMTMQVWDYSSCEIEEGNGTCCSSIDVDDARAVADLLDFPFYVANCEAKFKEKVIDPFIKTYLQGQTPSPCVNCNTYLKFDHLIRKMNDLSCDFLATGHYAQIQTGADGRPVIATSSDDWKDQTYFLFTLKAELLPKLLFPVGDWEKPKIREYAESRGLINARKKDSTGICFVGKKGYGAFIEEHVSADKLIGGEIRHYPSGNVMGQHDGIHHFTLGQRRGLGMDHHETLFVIKIDASDQTVWVGEEEHLYSSTLRLKETNWMSEFEPGERLKVKIRFHHAGSWAKITRSGDEAFIEFEQPQRAISPGQAAVVYRDNQLLGGGWICPPTMDH